MNAKRLVMNSCVLLCSLGLSSAFGQMHPQSGSHHMAMPQNRVANRWHDGDHDRDDHFHHHFFVRNVFFFPGFGYPYYFGYPYPYAYYYSPYYDSAYASGSVVLR